MMACNENDHAHVQLELYWWAARRCPAMHVCSNCCQTRESDQLASYMPQFWKIDDIVNLNVTEAIPNLAAD